jgi:hypothetical protein
MGKSSDSQKDDLLKVAAAVIAGERDRADLERYGIAIGEPIVGDDAKKMLVQELEEAERADEAVAEKLRAAETIWSKMAADGVQEGSRGPFEVVFVASDRQSADAIAAEFAGDEEWKVKVGDPGHDGQLRVTLITRPLVRGREVVVELANQMTIVGRLLGCEFVSLQPSSSRRPWWKFW